MKPLFHFIPVSFNWSMKGEVRDSRSGKSLPVEISMRARPGLDPGGNQEITGKVNIESIADNRPFLGTMEGVSGGSRLTIQFSDDEYFRQTISLDVSGLMFFDARPESGSIRREDEDKPWASIEFEHDKTASPDGLQFSRRKGRPKYRDMVGLFMARPSRPLPLRRTASALAEAMLPPGKVLDGGGDETIERLEESPLSKSPVIRWLLGSGLIGVEWGFRLSRGKGFKSAEPEDRLAFLEHPYRAPSLSQRVALKLTLPVFRPSMVVMAYLLKYFHVSSDEAHHRIGTTKLYGVAPELVETKPSEPMFAPDPPQPWESQIRYAESFDADEVVEADVVVVGTGAGGGPVAKELAEKGYAVAVIEAGKFYRREDNIFGSQDGTFALGNAAILLPMGRAVGGTTFINAGTCFRTPPEILMQWVEQGLDGFHPDIMAPYFDRVEEIIQVTEADSRYVGAIGEVVKRGCDKLGYSSHNLRRNAPQCEGQALCGMGCPHGAKLSTDKSYVPLALKSKATLFVPFKVREILTDGDRAVGVHAFGRGRNGKAVRLTVLARAVVLAAGALTTPVMIQRNGLVRGNKWVGANLSFHPASGAAAIVPGVEMKTHECIPQGYCVDEFCKEGLMFEGGNIPLSIWALMAKGIGKDYVDLVERFPNMGNFGYMVEDTSRGKVRPGIGDRPFVLYNMNKTDLDRLVKGMATLCRIFLAAGAERTFAATVGTYEMDNENDVKRFESKRWRPRDFFLSAYHCLGTMRLGPDPRMSAIDLDHQCHQVPGLFVTDGSAVPSSVGVNPQVTIMAVATRAADRIAERLE